MAKKFKIDKDVLKTADAMLDVLVKDIKRVEEGDEVALIKALGYKIVVTPMELMFAPMALSVFELMGQNGLKNLFFRGGTYFGKLFTKVAIDTGMAKWDETLLKHHVAIHVAAGWGYMSYSEIDLDLEKPMLTCFCKNHPCATVVPEIMEFAVGSNTSLTINYSQTFCDYHTGIALSVVRQILKNKGAKDEVLSQLKGKEEYCQAQKESDHCKHVIGIFPK